MMKPVSRVGLVVAGYVLAFLAASAVVATRVASTSGPVAQASSGMYAFGDLLLFLGAFGISAVPATCALLYFLRPVRSVWRILSIAAGATAALGLAAVIDYLLARHAPAGSAIAAWSALAVLKILSAPLFALAFLLACIFAPNRNSRVALALATLFESAGFACISLTWFWQSQR